MWNTNSHAHLANIREAMQIREGPRSGKEGYLRKWDVRKGWHEKTWCFPLYYTWLGPERKIGFPCDHPQWDLLGPPHPVFPLCVGRGDEKGRDSSPPPSNPFADCPLAENSVPQLQGTLSVLRLELKRNCHPVSFSLWSSIPMDGKF